MQSGERAESSGGEGGIQHPEKKSSSKEVLRQLILSHFLFWAWPRSMRKRREKKHSQSIKETWNGAPCTCPVHQGEHGRRLSSGSRQHIFAVKTGNTRKNNTTADWCLQLPLELNSGLRPQSKLTSPKATTRISQLFPHEQRSLYPRSRADNCSAGQVSAYWTQSPCLDCCFWTLSRFSLALLQNFDCLCNVYLDGIFLRVWANYNKSNRQYWFQSIGSNHINILEIIHSCTVKIKWRIGLHPVELRPIAVPAASED